MGKWDQGVAFAFGILLSACSNSGSKPGAGSFGASCYPNGTCNAGLTCQDNVCVGIDGGTGATSAAGGSAASGGATSSSGGTSATGGTTGASGGGTSGGSSSGGSTNDGGGGASGGGGTDALAGGGTVSSDGGPEPDSGPSLACAPDQCGLLITPNGLHSCGGCPAGTSCGGGGVAQRCGCTPLTCESMGMNCGTVDDGCGRTITCGTGTCQTGSICGGDGVPNVCSTTCTADGWCIVHGLPSDVTVPLMGFGGLWGSSANDVWAYENSPDCTGNDCPTGKLWHFNGTSWQANDPPILSNVQLMYIIGFSPNDFWATGRNADSVILLFHYDGASWSTVDTTAMPILNGNFTGTGPSDVWLDGKYYWDGVRWQTFVGPAALSGNISGLNYAVALETAPNDIWASDGSEFLYHFDGSQWSTVGLGGIGERGVSANSVNLFGTGSGANDIWFSSETVFDHLNSGSWTVIDEPGTTVDSPGGTVVWSDSADSAWERGIPPKDPPFGSLPAQMEHWNGTSFQNAAFYASDYNYDSSGNLSAAFGLYGVWGDRKGTTLAACGTGIYEPVDGAWSSRMQTAWTGDVGSCWARTESDAWCIGYYYPDHGSIGPQGKSIIHFNGTAWYSIDLYAPDGDNDPTLRDAWASSSTDLWIAGGLTRHWTSDGLQDDYPGDPGAGTAVSGTAANDVWMARQSDGNDNETEILHYDGNQWDSKVIFPLTATTPALVDVYAASSGDVWAVGTDAAQGHGLILHYESGTWKELTVPGVTDTKINLLQVWADSTGNAWIAGDVTVSCDTTDTCTTHATATSGVTGANGGPYFMTQDGRVVNSSFVSQGTLPSGAGGSIFGAGGSLWVAQGSIIARKKL